MNVNELMSREIVTCNRNSDLESAALQMWNADCGSLPVLDDAGRTIGMITDRDICMATALQHKSPGEIMVKEVINGKLFACTPNADVKTALRTMSTEKVRRLPVITADGHLEGLVSIDDVIVHADRGSRGQYTPALSYGDAFGALKSFCGHQH